MQGALAYIPNDRLAALAAGRNLQNRAQGAVLFADISGFTPLTNLLAETFGPRRGAEEATFWLNNIYTVLIDQIHAWGGSVVSFSGDGIMCWFERMPALDSPNETLRALACAVSLRSGMAQFVNVKIAPGISMSASIKTAIGAGWVRRFVVGDPSVQLIDVIAGSIVDRVGQAERAAHHGDILMDEATAAQSADDIIVAGRRSGDGQQFVLVTGLSKAGQDKIAAYPSPDLEIFLPKFRLPDEQVRAWLLPTVYTQLQAGQERFLAELRPAVAMFVRFTGLDYDHDPNSGEILDAYIRWVQQVLVQCHGSLIQLTTGDKGSYLYGAFGAPVMHDDDSEHAVAAALLLLAPPTNLLFRPAPQIGIMRGPMRVGAYGSDSRRTYGVQGAAVNLAARLMMSAEPGQIVVGEMIAEAVQAAYHVEDLGTILVKGRPEPLRHYAVVRRLPEWSKQDHADSGPLLGRDQEVAELQALIGACAGERWTYCTD